MFGTKKVLHFGSDQSSHHIEAVAVVEYGELCPLTTSESKVAVLVDAEYGGLVGDMLGCADLNRLAGVEPVAVVQPVHLLLLTAIELSHQFLQRVEHWPVKIQVILKS